MNKKIMGLAIMAVLILACDDSSNADNTASKLGLAEDVDTLQSLEESSALIGSVLSECKKESVDEDISVFGDEQLFDTVARQSSDTICLYNDFPYEDTICCFGELGSWLQRDENGKYINVSGDYSVGFDSDTLAAMVEPSSVKKCVASIGNEQYKGLEIGSQIWLSENAKGEGRCLNDDEKNCKLFGTLMPYDKAKEVCSGEYRLPTLDDIGRLLLSVGMVRERTYTKDVCGKLPGETSYIDVPLLAESQDSLNGTNAYGFTFLVDGGIYEKRFDGKGLAYSMDRTCFFLQSDESSDYRKAFCYDVNKKKASVTSLGKDAEVYARCIMK